MSDMTLSKLSCPKCDRVWYEEYVGKSLRDAAKLMSSVRCPTEGCNGQVVIHAEAVEVAT